MKYKNKITGAEVDAATALSSIDPAQVYIDEAGAEVKGSDILTPIVPPSLPDAPETEAPILSFAGALNSAVNLARENRNAQGLELMKESQGTLMASDFSSILNKLNVASDKTTENLIKEAIPDDTDFLSVSEAKELGVPYGTTKKQAAAMGITPPKKTDTDVDEYSDTDIRTISRAGLKDASPRVKDIFLNMPEKFRQAYIRNGFGNKEVTPEILLKNLEDWEKTQNDDADLQAVAEGLRAAAEAEQ